MRSRNWKPLRLIAFSCALLCATSAFARRDRIQQPESITATNGKSAGRIVSFAPDRKVVFTLGSAGKVTAITVHVGDSTFRVPAATCAKIPVVHFETVRLLWSGDKASPAEAGAFYVRLVAGEERERSFGSLPEYELFFRGDRFTQGKVKKQVSRSTAQYSDL